MFRKVLVANRGEIACRILRTLRDMDIPSVAVFSDADASAMHVRLADEACCIGPAAPQASYLRIDRILDAARELRVDAIHPGYGFLAENARFAQACEDAQVRFIGPSPAAMRALASKTSARQLMLDAGVPVVPGAKCQNLKEAHEAANRLGYPVLIKASHGGGGKGMRLVHQPEQLAGAWERARSEAQRAFGSGELYLEKSLECPRHVEIQVLGDYHGNVVHLFERDCSLQRRHQKVVEETPCPSLPREVVQSMGQAAIRGAKSVGYYSAGTFEFLVDRNNQFYFLEMNTRLQVEHPITEWVTGLDLVREMLRIADGQKLDVEQETILPQGAAIECRLYAEDPSSNFTPCPGNIDLLRLPAGPGVRVDSAIDGPATIPPDYDPLIAKLTVWAPTREEAIRRMRRALRECLIGGVETNLMLLARLINDAAFSGGTYDTHWLEAARERLLAAEDSVQPRRFDVAAAVALHALRGQQSRRPQSQPQGCRIEEALGPSPLTVIHDDANGSQT